MAVVDRNILRMAVYELLWQPDVPPKVGHQRGHRDRQEVRDDRNRAASSTACSIGSCASIVPRPPEPAGGVRYADPLGHPRKPRGPARGAGRLRGRGRRRALPGGHRWATAPTRWPAWTWWPSGPRPAWPATTSTRWAGRLRIDLVQPLRAGGGRVDAGAAGRRPPGLPDRAAGDARDRRRHPRARLAAPSPSEWDYLVTAEDGLRRLRRLRDPLCFVGHTHVPGVWSLGSSGPEHRPGAGLRAGRARAGATSSTSAAWASRATAIRGRPTRSGTSRPAACSIRRVDYDVATARRKIVDAGLPRFLADRLAAGA